MPSLFRRKPADLVADSVTEVTESPATPVQPTAKGYTPSKKELGLATRKRAEAERRRAAEPPPADRREAMRRMREKRRAERHEANVGMRRGDDRYLTARDRGPERALARDIVDSRRTAGTWFFGGALLVLVGSSGAMPSIVQLLSNGIWVLLAVAVLVDSVLIYRKIKSRVRERFPDTTQKLVGVSLYGVMRGLTFRRMRIPAPRVELGDRI
ncbi:DUF3043 domain-containing protein [Pilimelia columellifera]|uniref:DUF3043 domain-containing protein n=1 Tax=Pilimelia columellifera subsp. columellifera TaxID=706583 RepID=A0ABN3NPR5_9ACTN